MKILISNIGLRDLYHEKLAENKFKRNRSVGKELWEAYEQEKEHFSLPILGENLEMLRKEKLFIGKLLLFYTDQPEEVGDFRERDSLHTAKIIERFIRDHYSDTVDEICCMRIQGKPNNYDDMFLFYENEIKKLSDSYKAAYVLVSGGTPACNMSLILQSIRVFSEKLTLLQLDEGSSSGPRQLRLVLDLIRDYNQRAMHKMLDFFNFHGAATLLSDEVEDYELRCLADSANYRLMFDFENSLKNMQEIYSRKFDSEDQEFIETQIAFLEELNVLKNRRISFGVNCSEEEKTSWFRYQEMRIAETLATAIMKYESGMYVDYLGRVFRVIESMLRLVFEKETGYSSEEKRYDKKSAFQQFGDTVRGMKFKEYLKEKEYEANTLIFTKFLSYLIKNENKTEYCEILKCISRFEGLKALRNKSIIAHGFEDISRERIKEVCPKHDELLYGMSNLLKLNNSINNYRRIAEIIKKYY